MKDCSSQDVTKLELGEIVLIRSEVGAEIKLKSGNSFSITQPESSVLEALILAQGEVVSKQELIEKAWGRADIIGPNSLPVAITNLRKVLKLASINIINVPRQGYRVQPPEPEATSPPVDPPINATSIKQEKTARLLLPPKTFSSLIAAIGLLIALYGIAFTLFSWVSLSCESIEQAKVCFIQGDTPKFDAHSVEQGLYYYSTATGLLEVQADE